jgi:DNA invertase Pin-like site-specific DNA recombinase
VFQRMIDAARAKPLMFDVILVHSFSRFSRDQLQLEFYVRRLAKNGVRLISITQELGDDLMSNMIAIWGADIVIDYKKDDFEKNAFRLRSRAQRPAQRHAQKVPARREARRRRGLDLGSA